MKNLIIISFLFLSGCASIIDGKQQSVSFSSNPDGATVSLNGMQLGKTPTTLPISRRSGAQVLKFTKDGFKDTEFPIEANINNWFWGNIISGGLYGSTTDFISGAAYEYKPGSYMVTLQPNTGVQAPNGVSFNEKQKIINFIVMGYNQLITELNGKNGQYTISLFELAGVATENRDELRKKLKSLSDVYTVIPDFAEKSADLLLKK